MEQATCEGLLPLLAPYAEGSLTGRDRATVAEHVLGCAACRATVDAGRRARQLLRDGAPALRDPAPESLRRRIERSVAQVAPIAPRRRWAGIGRMPRSAAAALLLGAMGLVALGAFAPQGTVLAAQLGLDHLKCLLLADRQHQADPDQLAQVWQRERGWAIEVPPSLPQDRLELVALRRCLYGDGEMAHLVYEHGGRSLSLFILPRSRQARPELEIMGLGAVAWSREGRTYALVGGESLEELSKVAAYMQPLAR